MTAYRYAFQWLVLLTGPCPLLPWCFFQAFHHKTNRQSDFSDPDPSLIQTCPRFFSFRTNDHPQPLHFDWNSSSAELVLRNLGQLTDVFESCFLLVSSPAAWFRPSLVLTLQPNISVCKLLSFNARTKPSFVQKELPSLTKGNSCSTL